MEKGVIIFKIYDWNELKEWAWSGAIQVLEEIEKQNREDEAIECINCLLEEYDGFDEFKLNDYIWFDIADEMELYDEE